MSDIITQIEHMKQKIEHIQHNKMAFALVKLFSDLPSELFNLLEEAHLRYMHLIGITSGDFDDDVIANDRIKFAEIYSRSQQGKVAVFDDNDCIMMMSAIYGLPKLLCKLYIINDFNWTAASGFTPDAESDIQSACNDLEPYLKNDELLAEVATFLMHRELLVDANMNTPQ